MLAQSREWGNPFMDPVLIRNNTDLLKYNQGALELGLHTAAMFKVV